MFKYDPDRMFIFELRVQTDKQMAMFTTPTPLSSSKG